MLNWEIVYTNKDRTFIQAETFIGFFSIFVDSSLGREDNVELMFESPDDYGELGNYRTIDAAKKAADKTWLEILSWGTKFQKLHSFLIINNIK